MLLWKKAFMQIKKGYPFVPISITFDHIPRKSARHSVCLWEKMKDVHICRSWTAQHNKANILCLHLMFLFSAILLMLELIIPIFFPSWYSLWPFIRLCVGKCECLQALKAPGTETHTVLAYWWFSTSIVWSKSLK